jgi:hypothetical protein
VKFLLEGMILWQIFDHSHQGEQVFQIADFQSDVTQLQSRNSIGEGMPSANTRTYREVTIDRRTCVLNVGY